MTVPGTYPESERMAQTAESRVDFTNPPVVEVAIAVQFNTLPQLTTPHLGLFWGRVADRFPRVEEYMPRAVVAETFPRQQQPAVEQLLVHMTGRAPVSRCWFISSDDTQLIQVQADRFVFNWRKRPVSEGYPRYEFVRQQFDSYLAEFSEFLTEHNLGKIEPNQCEISYVNALDVPPGELQDVTSLWRGEYVDQFLSGPDAVQATASYLLNEGGDTAPNGRLHVSFRSEAGSDKRAALTLTARGKPEPADMSGVGSFLDLGHNWIVNGFVSVTKPTMHEKWGKIP